MGNLDKFQIEPDEAGRSQERGVDLDEISMEYAEKIREFLAEEKKNKTDIHLSKINPEELTYEDLMIYDKFIKGSLKEEELKEYRFRLQNYFNKLKEEKEKNGETYNFLNIADHSRSNIMAMVWHRFECRKINEKLAKRGIDIKNT